MARSLSLRLTGRLSLCQRPECQSRVTVTGDHVTHDASDSETVTVTNFARLYPNTHAGYWGSPSQGCLGPLLHYTALRHSLATGDSQLAPDSDSRVCYYACLSRYDYDIVRGIYLSLSTPRPYQPRGDIPCRTRDLVNWPISKTTFSRRTTRFPVEYYSITQPSQDEFDASRYYYNREDQVLTAPSSSKITCRPRHCPDT